MPWCGLTWEEKLSCTRGAGAEEPWENLGGRGCGWDRNWQKGDRKHWIYTSCCFCPISSSMDMKFT